VLEDGKELVALYGQGLTGLENLGNSCYVNSVVQVLFQIPLFRDRYLNEAQ
jgi:ubiquitin carboxyl-terminal hydrolase 5/13